MDEIARRGSTRISAGIFLSASLIVSMITQFDDDLTGLKERSDVAEPVASRRRLRSPKSKPPVSLEIFVKSNVLKSTAINNAAKTTR